jgi:hypothetical protein
MLSGSSFKLHGQICPTTLPRFRVMLRRAKAVAPDLTSAAIPANNKWYRAFDKAHGSRELMVRIHFPPAVSQLKPGTREAGVRGAVIHSAAARLASVFSWLEFRMPRFMLQLPGRREIHQKTSPLLAMIFE